MFGRQHGFGEGLHGEHEKDENALLMELDKGYLFRYSKVISHFLSQNQPIIAQKPKLAAACTAARLEPLSCATAYLVPGTILVDDVIPLSRLSLSRLSPSPSRFH